jgi:hypothetical protein
MVNSVTCTGVIVRRFFEGGDEITTMKTSNSAYLGLDKSKNLFLRWILQASGIKDFFLLSTDSITNSKKIQIIINVLSGRYLPYLTKLNFYQI